MKDRKKTVLSKTDTKIEFEKCQEVKKRHQNKIVLKMVYNAKLVK